MGITWSRILHARVLARLMTWYVASGFDEGVDVQDGVSIKTLIVGMARENPRTGAAGGGCSGSDTRYRSTHGASAGDGLWKVWR